MNEEERQVFNAIIEHPWTKGAGLSLYVNSSGDRRWCADIRLDRWKIAGLPEWVKANSVGWHFYGPERDTPLAALHAAMERVDSWLTENGVRKEDVT